MIEVKNITKTYGKKHNLFTALHDVSMTIPTGTTVAIVGKSGSGKSTLMHVMSGLDRPQQGSVVIDGVDITTLPAKKMDVFRAQKIGFIFQSFFVQGNEAVYDNVSLPLEITNTPALQRKQRVQTALESVDLLDKLKNKAKDLSGGQKQRLAIARAMVGNPQIIFADEPTGNLDSVTGATVEKLLFDYSKQQGVTLIIVTHDDDLAAQCDMQVNMKDGRVVSVMTTQKEYTA